MKIRINILLFFIIFGCVSKKNKTIFSTSPNLDVQSTGDSEPFRLIDQFSNSHAVSNYKNKKYIQIIYLNSAVMTPTNILKLLSTPKNQQTQTLYITNNADDDYSQYSNFSEPVLFDDFQFVTEKYKLKYIGDFVTFDVKTQLITQRGSIDFLLDKNPIPNNIGTNNFKLNFSKDVLPIFKTECLHCHMRYASIDYFSNMKSIQNYSKMSAKTMETYRMPLGGIDTRLKYQVEDRVKHTELSKIYHWLKQGANFTEEDDINLSRERSQDYLIRNLNLSKKKPDLILSMPTPHNIPATGSAYYESSILNTLDSGPTKEDAYYIAAKFEHNLEVLHHSNIHISQNISDFDTLKSETLIGKMNRISVKGKEFDVNIFQNNKPLKNNSKISNVIFSKSRSDGVNRKIDGTAVFVPKGSYFAVENHYHPNGTTQLNQSKISLYKYDQMKKPEVIECLYISPKKFVILPKEENITIESIIKLKNEIKLISVVPHMHYRGKDYKLFLKKNGSKNEELILSVPYYQLNLQLPVILAEPLLIPPNSELRLVVRYDNSDQNPSNPNSNQKVYLGPSTYNNEMHSMRIFYINTHIDK